MLRFFLILMMTALGPAAPQLVSNANALTVITEPEKLHPPGVLVTENPYMYQISKPAWKRGKDTFTPLYGYRIRARVLSKMYYRTGREANYAPFDLALGWKEMSDSSVLEQIRVTQNNRWYHYYYPAHSPVAPKEIPLESGNMHLIPANDDILATLRKVEKGDIIDAEGFLVLVQAPDGWHWKSGTSNTGEGEGSCKVIWVTNLTIEP